MKKLFNHTKRPVESWKGYDENDWDRIDNIDDNGDIEYYEGEEAYYVEESAENIEYYEEEAYYVEESAENIEYYEGEAYNGEESAENIEYYEGEAYNGEESAENIEYYEEEVYNVEEPAENIEYCGEEAYYGEESAENTEYYEGEAYYGEESAEDAEYYEEETYYEEDEPGEAGYYGKAEKWRRSQGGILYKLKNSFSDIGVMDKVIMGTGAAVLALALVTGGLFFSSRIVAGQVAAFADVGSQLDGIDMIGERGLLAVADAELARMEAAMIVQEEEQPKEYQEAEYERNITVSLNLTSVQKDLKIKFINKSNDKLVSNVPFVVTVTDSGGKSTVWSDDDMDGIIYKKDIAPGTYTVVMEALTGEQYSDYTLSMASQKVEVKKDIDYKKVDVANEIKKESEVNAAKEDTKQNVTKVESTLPDTVEWVESKVIDATYSEVSKNAIPNPETLAALRNGGTLNKMIEAITSVSDGNPVPTLNGITLDKSEVTVLIAQTATVNASLKGASASSPAVSAASADTNVATVSTSGTTVTVTGVNAGNTTVTVSYTEGEQTVYENFSVIVKSHPKDDTTTKLKDSGGNQLYVLENDIYREAVFADYYTMDRFFVRGGAKYFGWQTIDGKVYYYNANNEKVTGEQVIQGAKYNFASDGSLVVGSGSMGIDVSKWNGSIDWQAVSNSGVSYVIIRCGYRGSSEGKLIEDPLFAANIKGATAAGLKVGIYFFTQAVDEVEAVEEASMVLELVKGYKISYPIFLDVEPSGGRADSIDRGTRTAVCRAFCETIRSAGYTSGVYANKTWLNDKLNAGELSAYKIWLAQYAATPTYTGKYDLWQYKSTGSVSGVAGNVDMNLSYLGY